MADHPTRLGRGALRTARILSHSARPPGSRGAIAAAEHAVGLGVDGEAAGRHFDLRPTLPLILRW